MLIESGPRGPLLSGKPDNALTPIVNQVLQDGPEFLDLDWLDHVEPESTMFYLQYALHHGKTSMDAMQGAIIAPLMDRLYQKAEERAPFGLLYDMSRDPDKSKRYLWYEPSTSFTGVYNNRGEQIDPFYVLGDAVNDTLEEGLDWELNDLRMKNRLGLHEPRVRAYSRLIQLNRMFSNLDESSTPLGLLYAGTGTAGTITGAISKITPLLLLRDGVRPKNGQTFIELSSRVADNTANTIANLAMLDMHSFTASQPTYFEPLLKDYSPQMLDNFVLAEIGDGELQVDVSDAVREQIKAWHEEDKDEEIVPRNGCPFRAIISHEREGRSISVAGVVDLWRFTSPARNAIYSELYREAA